MFGNLRPIDLDGPVERPFRPIPESWLARPIFDIFAETAQNYADKKAIDDGENFLTYGEIHQVALSLARRISKTVDRGSPVGIALPNGVTYPVAMLAALAAGCPYVPLDLSFPEERNARILDNCGMKAVIVDDGTRDAIRRMHPALPQLHYADAIGEDDAALPHASPDDIAVIFYTSGSTGQPKGVHHDQRNVVHHMMLRTNSAHIAEDDEVLLLFAPMVPVAQQDIFSALLSGARLFIVDLRRNGLQEAVRVMRRRRITQYHSVPFVFRELLQLSRDPKVFASVRQVLLSTDRVFPVDVELFRQRFPATTRFSTGLGSTEGKLFCHWFVRRNRPMLEPIVPVGYVLPGFDIALVDANGDKVPLGQIGEMIITSRYLARGYWNDREATERAFAVAPFDPSARVFRTGDLGRMRQDGLLELVGRKDRQIKIRGYRVEPTEVQATIRTHPEVRDAAVISRGAGDDAEIVAFVVPTASAQLTTAGLSGWLGNRLMDAMRPREIYLVDAIPMLGNFKQDIQKLQELDRELSLAPKMSSTLPAPVHEGAVYDAVRAEWARQVGASAFHADMTWDEAGGNSLKSLELVFELESSLRRLVPMALLKPNTRPSELIASLEHGQRAEGFEQEGPTPATTKFAATLNEYHDKAAGTCAAAEVQPLQTIDVSVAAAIAPVFDPFAAIRASTNAHRALHHCFAFPFSEGAMLGVMAGAVKAKRILELGTGLGYTALWFAHGASEARIDTIELDPDHVRIARENFAAYGYADRITAHQGNFAVVMPTLSPGYDLAFFDGFGPTFDGLSQLRRLLRPGGMLISSNLTVGSQTAAVLAELTNPEQWLTTFALESGRTAISLLL